MLMKIDGYPTQQYKVPVKRYCQCLRLKDNPELIAAYRALHSREKAWPEIRAGIRQVGILEMEIYILGCQLFMIVEAPLEFDWTSAMAQLNTLPRQADWEATVAPFQECLIGATSSEKWKLMERMFYLYND